MQWAGGYAARYFGISVALSFSRFDGDSRPSHLPLTPAVERLAESNWSGS